MFRARNSFPIPILAVSWAVAFLGVSLPGRATADAITQDSTQQSAAPQIAAAPDTSSSSDPMAQYDKDFQVVQQIVPLDTPAASDEFVKHIVHIDKLKPGPPEPGLVVCEPVARPGNTALADFGAGCGRWIQLVAAGQPQFGRTPTWSSLSRAVSEMKIENLGLDLHQAAQLGPILGASHVAVGTINGTPAHCTLTYRLYRLSDHKAIGGAFSASGSEQEILSALPNLARAMAVKLGAAAPRVPARVGVNPSQMAFLGNCVHECDAGKLPYSATDPLRKLASRDPLAGMLYLLEAADVNESETEEAIRVLVAELPDNPIPLAQLGQTDQIDLIAFKPTIEADLHRYPGNALFASTDVWLHREDFDAQAERTAAEQAVCDAPLSTDAWLTFAATVSNEADNVRKARIWDVIPASEQGYVSDRNDEWCAACVMAVRLDPNNAKAWRRLTEAATFDGDDKLAYAAFDRALKLDDTSEWIYSWGLEMYQPKWLDDPLKLRHIAKLAAGTAFPTAGDTLDVYDDLNDAGFSVMAAAFITRYVARLSAYVSSHPNDAAALLSLADCYSQEGQSEPAIELYKSVTKLQPSDASAYDALGQEYFGEMKFGPAIAAYERVLALDPRDKGAQYQIALTYFQEGNIPEALAEVDKALILSPFSGDAHFLQGQIDSQSGRHKEAAEDYAAALQCQYGGDFIYEALSSELELSGQYDQGVQIAYEGLLADPENTGLMEDIAQDFYQENNYDRSIAVALASLQVMPKDLILHYVLSEDYSEKGDVADSDKERLVWSQLAGVASAAPSQSASEPPTPPVPPK